MSTTAKWHTHHQETASPQIVASVPIERDAPGPTNQHQQRDQQAPFRAWLLVSLPGPAFAPSPTRAISNHNRPRKRALRITSPLGRPRVSSPWGRKTSRLRPWEICVLFFTRPSVVQTGDSTHSTQLRIITAKCAHLVRTCIFHTTRTVIDHVGRAANSLRKERQGQRQEGRLHDLPCRRRPPDIVSDGLAVLSWTC